MNTPPYIEKLSIYHFRSIVHVDGKYKKDANPLLTHWSYVFLALIHRCVCCVVECLQSSQHPAFAASVIFMGNRGWVVVVMALAS